MIVAKTGAFEELAFGKVRNSKTAMLLEKNLYDGSLAQALCGFLVLGQVSDGVSCLTCFDDQGDEGQIKKT